MSRAALATWIRHQSVPETTDRDSAQRWPRRNPHALRHVGARLGVPHRARLGRDVAVVAVASGRDAVAAEATFAGNAVDT